MELDPIQRRAQGLRLPGASQAAGKKGLIELPSRIRGAIGGRPQRRGRLQLGLPLDVQHPEVTAFPESVAWHLALRGPAASIYKDLLATHHYLGYHPEVGHALRYVAYAEGHPIACLGWAAAAWKVACRDRFIGWSPAQRQRHLHLVADNTRFLILPRVPHLASHLLAACVRKLPGDWQKLHGYAPVLLETFVDTTRFKGTCYKAANWTCVGRTQGRGKYDRLKRRAEPVKAVYLYPLRKDFRQILNHD